MPQSFAPRSETFAVASKPPARPQLQARAGGGQHHIAGLVEMREIKPGLVLQRMRVQDLADKETQGTVLPGVKIGLVVGGRSDFWLGPHSFRLGPQAGAQAGAMLVAVAEPDAYRRQAHRGQAEHKLVLSLLPEWLEQLGGEDARARARIQAFGARHLARLDWRPSARAIALAHQIVHGPERPGLIEQLYQEARVMEIVAEGLAAVAGEAPPQAALSLREHRRLRELQGRLDAGEFEQGGLAEIANSVGMSVSSLQRSFKAFAGEGLFEYLRGRKLDAAREALAREGLSVGQAAALAGYGNAANFATAFKRRFGCSPSALRARG